MLTTLATIAAVGAAGLGTIQFSPHLVKLFEIRRLGLRCRSIGSVLLTYDDGPGESLTPELLRILNEAGVRGTFFPTVRSARRLPELLGEVAAAGHEIGCHSANHVHAWKASPWRTIADVDEGYTGLADWIRPDSPYRAPYGKITWANWHAVRRRGAQFAWWTVDSGDTRATLPQPSQIVEQLARDGGGVVLLHDFDRKGADAEERHRHVIDVTRHVIEYAKHSGLTLCIYSELFTHSETSRRKTCPA